MTGDIKAVIEGCQKNQRNAQKELYDLFSAKMYQTCVAYMTDREEAQDVLHDGFFKVFKSIHQFNSSTNNIEGWIRRIMINTAIDKLRRAQKFRMDSLDDMYYQGSNNDLSDHIKENDIVALVATLPEGARTIFNLYTLEGYKHKEIAKILGITEGTSKSQFSRARQILQDLLNKHYT